MKKLILLTLIGAAFAAPVYATNQTDIDADKAAIRKDNAALSNDNAHLAKDRAAKAAAKANGSYGSEAVDSAKIGGVQTEIGEKNVEKDADQKILQHHENDMSNSTGQ